jgi:hypothetical protein
MTDRAQIAAEALWYVAPGRAEIRPEAVMAPGPGEVQIRTSFTALSRGTESLVFSGRVPASEFVRMRGPNMGGAFPFPVKYGYAAVGRVEHGPGDLAGRMVFALHPHQSVFTLPAIDITPLPENVPPARALLAANMETALNAVWDAAPGPADRIAVVGGGVVGALIAWLCGRLPGAEVTLIDILPERATLAQALGVQFALPGGAAGECDLVFHASGQPSGLSDALRLAGDEATVVEMSWYGATSVPVPLGESFHSRRLRLVSSQVGQVAASHRPRWSYPRRRSAAIALLTDACLDALIAPGIAFAELPAKLPRILERNSTVLCQRIDYPPTVNP